MDHDHSGLGASSYHHGALRAALLEAAEAMLEESGVDRFTLRGVARRVGVSHAAPAHHFVDVRGVLTELATIGFESLSRTMEEEHEVRAGDRLTAIGLGYVRFAIERPALFGLMWRTDRLDRTGDRYRVAARRAFQILEETMAAVHRAAGRPASGPSFDADVRLAWASVHGLGTLINAGHLTPDGDARRDFASIAPWVGDVVRRMVEAARASPGRAAASGPAPAPSARSGSG